MNAIIYTRFSPRRNSDESESCDVQLIVNSIVQRRGIRSHKSFTIPTFRERTKYREKLWLAINAIEKGMVLIVYKRDRLARNVFLSSKSTER